MVFYGIKIANYLDIYIESIGKSLLNRVKDQGLYDFYEN